MAQQPLRRVLLLALLLCLDAMFLLHVRCIGSTFLYSLHAVFALLILFRFRRQVQDLSPVPYARLQPDEEGAKFLGIATWLAFGPQASAGAGKLKA